MRRAYLPLLLVSSMGAFGFGPLPRIGQEAAKAAVEETYSLVHKHVKDESQTVTMKIEGKFGEVSFVSSVEMTQKTTEVAEDGGYTVQITTGQTTTKVNGEDVPDDEESSESKTTTTKYDAKGNEIKESSDDEEEGNGPVDIAFEWEPKAPVKIGESWTPEKEGKPDPIEWTLTGKEDLAGKPVLVIEGKGKGPTDETIETKAWVDPITFLPRKATSTIRGIKQEDAGEGEMTITIEEEA